MIRYMKKKLKNLMFFTVSFTLVFLIMIGCNNIDQSSNEKEGLYIMASISIIADLVENIVGDKGTVEYIVPVGSSPEDFELLPSDLNRINKADILFVNGLGLEEMIIRSLNNIADTEVVIVSEGTSTIPLVGNNVPDPHVWFDVNQIIIYVENIYRAIVEIDPENSEFYQSNKEKYVNQLNELDQYIKDQVSIIPSENRVIVISENALKYFGDAYGFLTEGIWELNSHEEGTPQQIARIVDIVTNKQLPAIFKETTLDSRFIEMISRETGVPIAGSLYTDALGKSGSGAETYIDMMKYNVDVLIQGLQ